MSKFIPFWMDGTISDDGIIAKLTDNRVCVDFEACGNTFSKLLKYTFDDPNKKFTENFYKDEFSNLIPIVKIPKKDSFYNISDQIYIVKSYRYILPALLALDLLPIEMKKNLYLWNKVKEDFDNRADFLEYYIINDPTNIREKLENNRSYYSGRIESNLHILIKEMYLLARRGNKRTRWMLAFNNPMQIWFILITQSMYLTLWNTPKVSNEQYYKQTIKIEELFEDNRLHLKTLDCFKSVANFNIHTACHYTIAQLINDCTSPISSLYTNYLKSIKKQAYALARTNNYDRAF